MSGICGIFNYTDDHPVDKTCVGKMLDAIDHGASSNRKIIVSSDNRAAFGCLTPGYAETFQTAAEFQSKASIVLAGFAFCEGKGIDANAVLEKYLKDADGFTNHIYGPYISAIYDAQKKRISLVRDRIGVRSLYYGYVDGCAVFASNIRGILAHPSFGAELDDEGLFHYFTFGASPPPNTLFKNIIKLAPAESVLIDENGKEERRKYWSMLAASKLRAGSPQETGERIRYFIDEAVRLNLQQGTKADIFLSGGVDSAAMLAFLRKNHSGTIRSYTAGFSLGGRPLPGELNDARATSEHFGSEHSEVMVELNEMGGLLWEVACAMDDPYGASESPLIHVLALRAAREGAGVVFYGEGADGAFPGDDSIALARMLSGKVAGLERMPRVLTRAGRWLYDTIGMVRKGGEHSRFISELLWRMGHGQRPFRGTAIAMNDRMKARLLPPRLKRLWRECCSDEFVEGLYSEIEAALPGADMLQKMRFINYQMWTAEYWAEASFRSAGLKAVMPFLYEPLVEYAMSIPVSAISKRGSAKSILRDSLSAVLPAEVTSRKKVGFTEPLEKWFEENLAVMLDTLLEKTPAADGECLNFRGVHEVIDEHRCGKANHKWLMFHLITLLMWYRRWIEGKTHVPETV